MHGKNDIKDQEGQAQKKAWLFVANEIPRW